MNTKEIKNDVQKEALPLDESPLKDDKIISILEKKVKELERKNTEVKFLLFLCVIILLDVIFFSFINNWAGAVCVTILEIILIIYVGRMSDVKDVEILSDKILHAFAKRDRTNSAD